MSYSGEMAYHGHQVKMFDSSLSSLNSAYERIEEDKRQLQKDGLLPLPTFIVRHSLVCDESNSLYVKS